MNRAPTSLTEGIYFYSWQRLVRNSGAHFPSALQKLRDQPPVSTAAKNSPNR